MSEVAKPTFKNGESLNQVWTNNAAASAAEVEAPTVEVVIDTPPPATVETVAAPPVEATPPATTPESVVEENISTFTFPDFEETSADIAAAPATTTPATQDWKSALKTVDKKEVLKELGVSDFALELNEYIAAGGNAADYISAKAIDWKSISDEDVVKADLKKQFPTFSATEINRLFSRKYDLSEELDPQEKEDNLLLLKADAHIKREQKIQDQSKFKMPETIQPQANTVSAQEQEIAAQQQYQQMVNWYNEQDATKSLMTSKRVTLDLGANGGKFNFNVERPELLTKALVDANTWQKITSNKQGEPDIAKMQKIALYAMNPEQFEMDIFNYGVSKAKSSIVNEARNITPAAKVLPMNGANTTEKEAWKGAKSSTVGGR